MCWLYSSEVSLCMGYQLYFKYTVYINCWQMKERKSISGENVNACELAVVRVRRALWSCSEPVPGELSLRKWWEFLFTVSLLTHQASSNSDFHSFVSWPAWYFNHLSFLIFISFEAFFFKGKLVSHIIRFFKNSENLYSHFS